MHHKYHLYDRSWFQHSRLLFENVFEMTELAFGLLGYCHRQSLLLKYFYIQMAYFQEKQDVLCSNIHKTMLERITPGTTIANSQLPQE